MRKSKKQKRTSHKGRLGPLTMGGLSIEDALRGAMSMNPPGGRNSRRPASNKSRRKRSQKTK